MIYKKKLKRKPKDLTRIAKMDDGYMPERDLH
jgi:hypothetical protein